MVAGDAVFDELRWTLAVLALMAGLSAIRGPCGVGSVAAEVVGLVKESGVARARSTVWGADATVVAVGPRGCREAVRVGVGVGASLDVAVVGASTAGR